MNSKTSERRKDPERLFRIVDKVLKQVIGEPATLFIYKYLEEEHSLKREDIPNELEIFEKGLEKYFSISGASAVLGVIQSESPELRMKILRARNQMAIEIKRGKIGSFKNGNRN